MKTTLLFLAAAALLPAGVRADHQDFITVNANAAHGYTERKFVNGVPQPQTYAFFEGKFFGETNDPTLRRLSFGNIARILAPDLAKQNYFPAKDYRTADLVIVVNWGSTYTDPTQDRNDTERQFQFDAQIADIRSYNSAFSGGALPGTADIQASMTSSRNDAFSAQASASQNAQLLGYTAVLNKELALSWAYTDGLSAKAESYLADLSQERYFVVLLAYDYQEMKRAHLDDAHTAMMGGAAFANATTQTAKRDAAPPLPVWSVRMNIKAVGNSFTQALPAMSEVASDYFGKQMDQLATARVSVGSRSQVEIGDAKVMTEAR
jgi:hypothetical protein